MNENLLKKLAKPLIVIATLIWGSTFFIMKDTLDSVDLQFLLAFRFTVAAVVLAAVFWKRWKGMDLSCWWRGAVMGLFMYAAYTVQNYGLIHTTPGTPFVYQGEEIGMVNVAFDTIDDYNCCYTVGDYHAMVQGGVDPAEALAILGPKSRDNARTPYQWDDSENAGFTSGTPWMKVNPSYRKINLAADRNSVDSIFAFYQKLIAMRKEHPAILDGDLQFYLQDHPNVILYTRRCARQLLLVIANKSDAAAAVELPEELKRYQWELILTNYPDTAPSLERSQWLPWECEVYSRTY